MCGRKPVQEQRHIQIHYAKFKTKRHVCFLSHVARLHSGFQFTCSSMKFLTDIKKKIKPDVDSLYEFDTSRAPDSIGRNARRARALLTKATFIYRVCLIVSHLQPTEYRHTFHRISTSASAASPHVILINTAYYRKLSISCGSRTRTTSGLPFMNTLTLTLTSSHTKSLPL